ncbi:hel-1 [Spodoptera litura granulovirus]|uniref:Hel-1 n=1 Tax=Spodoptera litura granulovirus TaxID=359919 RepID=A5IZT2_9BBAC|nr:hel-1 [Spodoptera litura granulovirus]ABQ52023.1 hel-1 [Spodoptera litura granulovirus]
MEYINIGDLLQSYQKHEKLTGKDYVSNEYWLFVDEDSGDLRRKHDVDIDFCLKVFDTVHFKPHRWCHVGNYFNTTIKPFMPKSDFKRLSSMAEYRSRFNFDQLLDGANTVCEAKNYVYWPKLSAKFFGWLMYLKLNFNFDLCRNIPLPNHEDIGGVNLFTNKKTNMDICTILRNDETILFCNGPFLDTNSFKYTVLEVEIKTPEGGSMMLTMDMSDYYVGTKNQVIFNYLVNNENIVACNFTDEFKYLGEVDLKRLRRSDCYETEDDMDVDDYEVETKTSNEIRVSPSSLFKFEFETKIDECLELINDSMEEAMPNHNCVKFLQTYMNLNNYETFPYLIVNVWQYCLDKVNLHNQYTLEDILMFLYILCSKMAEDEEMEQLYNDNQIYISSKDNAQKFFNSLNFFALPQRALGYYFAIHFAIYKKFETWDMTSGNVFDCDLSDFVKSFGFFKKVKHNEVSYVFNGKIYEFVKNKKDHDIASKFEKADEAQVSVFKFNNLLNFYSTEDGMFDVCTKTFRPSCPFLVVSALKRNYITKAKQFVDKEVFLDLFAAMKNDVMLLQTYHAKKFEIQFNCIFANFKDCILLGPKIQNYKMELLEKMKQMIKWVMGCDESMLILLMMKLKLEDYLHNVIRESDDVDKMGLQLAVTLQLLWPKAGITQYIWSLLKSDTYFEIMFNDSVLNANEIFEPLGDIRYYNNRKYIIERVHDSLKKNIVFLLNEEENHDQFFFDCIYNCSESDCDTYERNRLVKKINLIYNRYKNIPSRYDVWTDKLIEYNSFDDMYTWLTRFYKRMYLRHHIYNMSFDEENLLTNFVQGFCYFRVLTNFNITNSKAIINFCASLAIPTDYEKMCLVITSEPNCGKSSLFELLDKIILVYKSDRKIYDHNQENNSSKIKRFESQLYIMNEAEITTKGYLKNIADSTKFDSANRKYGPEESFYANYKVMITNNEMLYIKDGYDKACSNRIGQIYIDHSFESDIEPFDGSIYECYERKKYHEIKDINMKLKSPVKQFLANVLMYNSDPKTGYVYYKSILQNDKCYKHNKKCLYIYNDRLEAMLYVLDVKEVKPGTMVNTKFRWVNFNEERLVNLVTNCIDRIKQMVHFRKRENVEVHALVSDFHRKYGRGKHFNAETSTYENLSIISSEKYAKIVKPRLKSSVDEYMM